MKEEFLQVTTTCETKADADRIAYAVVDKKLAACAQVLGPIESTYHWQGKIEKAQEWICLIKTKRTLYADLEQALTAIHPYDTPEIIAVPITTGSEKYLAWLDEATGK